MPHHVTKNKLQEVSYQKLIKTSGKSYQEMANNRIV